ncbi:MAG: hypothetical protein ACRECH_16125 [Nitrososphaerales archaeon]
MNQPEPFASFVDVLQAGKKLEDAIHSATGEEAYNDLVDAEDWLDHAEGYFKTGASLSGAQSYLYQRLQNETATAIQQLDTIALTARRLEGSELQSFQSGTIYAFQGVLGKLAAGLLHLVGLATFSP